MGNKNEKLKATAEVAGISTAGGAVGAAVASAAGIAFAVPIAIGAGIGCLTFAAIKLVKDKKK